MCNGANESPITSRTVRSQQEWMCADRGLLQVNLRKQFVADTINLITGFQKLGHDIVVMVDANEPSGSCTAVDIVSLTCGLIDTHSLSSVATQPPATYHRGSEKNDFILVSPRPALAVRAASILALHDGYLSDHRALIVDFDAETLFADGTSEIVLPHSRQLTSINPAAVKAYIKQMLPHIEYHRIAERVARLTERSDNCNWGQEEVLEWEKIDASMVQARAAAEAKCPKKRSGKYPWSPEFDHAGKSLVTGS